MGQKPKICIVSHSYPHFPGDWRANFIEALAQAYARKAEVVVFTPYVVTWKRPTERQGPPGYEDSLRIVHYHYAPLKSFHTLGVESIMKGDLSLNVRNYFVLPFMLLFGVIQLSRLFRSERFDFAQAHWAVPNTFMALAARFLSGTKTKIFTSFPGSDVTVLSNLGWCGKLAAQLIGRSDFLSCNSSDLKEDLVKAGIEAERIKLVIYGVDSRKIRFDGEKRLKIRERYGILDPTPLLLLIGRFVEKKGFSTAFRALKVLKEKGFENFQVMVVGSGPLQDEYEAILQKDGTRDKVIFVGNIPSHQLSEYYSASDILLMPSRRLPSDGLNVVVPEAMACGRPVIASNVGGNDLVVFHGQNGFLHRENDEAQLAEQIIELASHPELMATMGQTSLQLIQERFNWDAIAEYYMAQSHQERN